MAANNWNVEYPRTAIPVRPISARWRTDIDHKNPLDGRLLVPRHCWGICVGGYSKRIELHASIRTLRLDTGGTSGTILFIRKSVHFWKASIQHDGGNLKDSTYNHLRNMSMLKASFCLIVLWRHQQHDSKLWDWFCDIDEYCIVDTFPSDCPTIAPHGRWRSE